MHKKKLYILVLIVLTSLVVALLLYAQNTKNVYQDKDVQKIRERPTKEGIERLITQAAVLGKEISDNPDKNNSWKVKKFNTIFDELVDISILYPGYQNYYKEILLNNSPIEKKLLIASIVDVYDSEGLLEILGTLLDDQRSSSRITALMYIEDVKYKRFIPKVANIAKNDSDIGVKMLAASTLHSLKSE